MLFVIIQNPYCSQQNEFSISLYDLASKIN